MCIRIFKKLCCCCCCCCRSKDKGIPQSQLHKKGYPRPVNANDYYRRQGYNYNHGSVPYKTSHGKKYKGGKKKNKKHYNKWGDIEPVIEDDGGGGSCWDCSGGGDGGGDGGGGGGDGGGGGGGV